MMIILPADIPPVLVLTGPTAVGKTALSLEMAARFNLEIVSADSMQVYRYMDIGTAKASVEEREQVPHHLIDIVDPDEEYNAARFEADARQVIAEIHARGKMPLLTGGTGLYIRAALEGLFSGIPEFPELREELKKRLEEEGRQTLHQELQRHDPQSAARIHENDSQRLVRALEIFIGSGKCWSWFLERQVEEGGKLARYPHLLKLGLTCERKILYERINLRSDLMFQRGLEQEVLDLRERGYGPELKAMQSIGYRHMNNYLDGLWSLDEAREKLARDTRRYAKRQYTWFNADPEIVWCDVNDPAEVLRITEKWLSSHYETTGC